MVLGTSSNLEHASLPIDKPVVGVPLPVRASGEREDSRGLVDNPGVTEAELLAEAQSGDRAALEALLRRFEPRVLRFGLRLCRNSADAEDIVQETLLAAARTLGRFRGEASPSTWLYTIARSFCIKKRRRSRHAPEVVSMESEGGRAREVRDPGRGPDRLADDRRLRVALEAAIATLAPAYREILLLRDVEGLPAAEVARATLSRWPRSRAASTARGLWCARTWPPPWGR